MQSFLDPRIQLAAASLRQQDQDFAKRVHAQLVPELVALSRVGEDAAEGLMQARTDRTALERLNEQRLGGQQLVPDGARAEAAVTR